MTTESAFKTFDHMYTEAENNHSTKRFVDSAKIFNHLATQTIKSQMYEDAIYMAYREIVEYNFAKKPKEKAQAIARLGEFCLNLAANQARSIQEETDDQYAKIEMMRIAEKCYRMLGHTEKKESILHTFIDLNTTAIRNSTDLLEQVNLHRDQIRIKKELGEDYTLDRQEIIHLLISHAKQQKKESFFNPKELEATFYVQAIPYLKEELKTNPDGTYKKYLSDAIKKGNNELSSREFEKIGYPELYTKKEGDTEDKKDDQ